MSKERAEQVLALCRVVMLGDRGCGKTSIVNVFVNNFCPTVYTETDDPTLYYKTLHLPQVVKFELRKGFECKAKIVSRPPAPPNGDMTHKLEYLEGYAGTEWVHIDEKEQIITRAQARSYNHPIKYQDLLPTDNFPVLVEIEDTYAVDREGEDCYGRSRNLESFLRDTFIDAMNKNSSCRSGAEPWETYDPPVAGQHLPYATNRIAFMVVFDVNDEKSLDAAKETIARIESTVMAQVPREREPVVALVANKYDQSNRTDEHLRLEKDAKLYVETRSGRLSIKVFETCSALEMRKITRAFRRLLVEAWASRPLWTDDGETHRGPRTLAPSIAAPSCRPQ